MSELFTLTVATGLQHGRRFRDCMKTPDVKRVSLTTSTIMTRPAIIFVISFINLIKANFTSFYELK